MVTRIIGSIADSTGIPITGYLTVKLNAPMINETPNPDQVRYTKPTRYKLQSGSFDDVRDELGNSMAGGIQLVPSNEPTYQFSYEYEVTKLELYLDGVLYTGDYHKEGSNYYTGVVNFAGRQQLTPYNRITLESLFEPINTSIPDQATIEWSKLQHSSINTSNINTSAYFIAGLVASDYAKEISLNLATPKGNWNISTVYQTFDVVFNPGDNGTYWYINDNPSSGNPVTDSLYWMKIGQASSGGSTGIQPSDVLLDLVFGTGWQTESGKAPVASRLFTQLSKYAELTNTPYFTNNARGITRNVGDNTDHFATTGFIQAALNSYAPPPSTTAPDINLTDKSLKIVNSNTLKNVLSRITSLSEERSSGTNGGIAVSGWNTRALNTYYYNGGSNVIPDFPGIVFTLEANAQYWIEAWACVCGVGKHRLFICQNNSPTFTILLRGRSMNTGMEGYQLNVVPNDYAHLSGRYNVGASPIQCVLRHWVQTVGRAEDLGKATSIGGNEIYSQVNIFRID